MSLKVFYPKGLVFYQRYGGRKELGPNRASRRRRAGEVLRIRLQLLATQDFFGERPRIQMVNDMGLNWSPRKRMCPAIR